jgi:hypothetical protein
MRRRYSLVANFVLIFVCLALATAAQGDDFNGTVFELSPE